MEKFGVRYLIDEEFRKLTDGLVFFFYGDQYIGVFRSRDDILAYAKRHNMLQK